MPGRFKSIRITSGGWLRAIPAIALTANAMPHDVERGLAAGFDRYLTKPIEIGKFNEAIDGVLAQRRARIDVTRTVS
ncbi:MAG: response regulator [Oxalobacteraceae bacterium]|nr:MAG: response regulator [Oxalobacteraceae bacterium]